MSDTFFHSIHILSSLFTRFHQQRWAFFFFEHLLKVFEFAYAHPYIYIEHLIQLLWFRRSSCNNIISIIIIFWRVMEAYVEHIASNKYQNRCRQRRIKNNIKVQITETENSKLIFSCNLCLFGEKLMECSLSHTHTCTHGEMRINSILAKKNLNEKIPTISRYII